MRECARRASKGQRERESYTDWVLSAAPEAGWGGEGVQSHHPEVTN